MKTKENKIKIHHTNILRPIIGDDNFTLDEKMNFIKVYFDEENSKRNK
jgi:hypothetical protein